jgi:hypothetical protein
MSSMKMGYSLSCMEVETPKGYLMEARGIVWKWLWRLLAFRMPRNTKIKEEFGKENGFNSLTRVHRFFEYMTVWIEDLTKKEIKEEGN